MRKFILTLIMTRHKLKKTTLYLLLTGKKTSSILVFGYFNQLLPFFGLFRNLRKEDYENALMSLKKTGLIEEKQGFLYSRSSLEAPLDLTEYPFLKGYPYSVFDQELWGLFLFSLQVLSEKSFKNAQYLPLSQDFLTGVKIKVWLKKNHLQEEKILMVKEEIAQLNSQLPQKSANRLSQLWQGHEVLGQVPAQIYPLDKMEGYLTYYHDLHSFIFFLKQGNYPLLKDLLQEKENSVSQTKKFLTKDSSLSQLQRKRPELKPSTLRDHLLEIAILEEAQFPFENFIQKETKLILNDYVKNHPQVIHWDYKTISSTKEMDFLSYRLWQINYLSEVRK